MGICFHGRDGTGVPHHTIKEECDVLLVRFIPIEDYTRY